MNDLLRGRKLEKQVTVVVLQGGFRGVGALVLDDTQQIVGDVEKLMGWGGHGDCVGVLGGLLKGNRDHFVKSGGLGHADQVAGSECKALSHTRLRPPLEWEMRGVGDEKCAFMSGLDIEDIS